MWEQSLYVKGSDLEKPLATEKVEHGFESENGQRKLNKITWNAKAEGNRHEPKERVSVDW